MFDFGLLPCPMCGGEPEVAQLTQGPEELTAVIKCTVCGLTLDWATEIKVGVSRSGKRTAAKAGLDPIEAWNRRAWNQCQCDNCGRRIHSEQVGNLHDCNDCGVRDCEYKPRAGESVRINCHLWQPIEK